MLTIKNLNAGYRDVPVLKNISLELKSGSMYVFMGPNGAGKSTLLKSIFNLTDIQSGSIFFREKEITRSPAHSLLGQGIAYVAQGRINFGTLSIRDNLLLGVHNLNDASLIEKRLEEIYEQFPNLKIKEKQYAFSLSGGEQQMLAIGRALMSAPKLLLLDEPSLGLAPKLVKEVFAKIREIKEKFGTTIVIVEHNLKSLMDIADYGYVMVAGEIIVHDACAKLKNSEIMKQVFVGKFD